MSRKPSNSEPSTSQPTLEASQSDLAVATEIGETIELVVAGQRVEAFLSDEVFVIDPHTKPGRTAIRAYAFALAAAGQKEEAKAILKHVGREG